MDYEKAYKEALKRAKSFRTPDNKDVAAYIFPELAESEDEEIRQELISLFRDCINGKNHPYNSCDSERWLAWLEKQDEQKPILDVEIPFGAKDSELEEVTYDIPKGYHAEIDGNKVVIRKGEQKSDEWSEEDENLFKLSLENLTELKDRFGEEYGKVGDCIVWFESIKDRIQHQTSWKPSGEQMRILDLAIRCGINRGTTEETTLVSLFNDLKKLREE